MQDLYYKKLWHKDLARQIDINSTKTYLGNDLILMENAGLKIAEYILKNLEFRPIVVLAGKGNNAGDGLAAARYLYQYGYEIIILKVFENGFSRLCNLEFDILKNLKLNIKKYDISYIKNYKNPVILDAIYGIGYKKKDKKLEKIILDINSIKEKTLIAVDIPSGLDANYFKKKAPFDTDITITFGNYKPIHLIDPSASSCGKVILQDIFFPQKDIIEAYKHHDSVFFSPKDSILKLNLWDFLPSSSHKFDRGHVLVIGGSPGKIGAPLLSAKAALKTGAGWVSAALYQNLNTCIDLELTFEDFYENGQILFDKFSDFIFERNVKSILIGPGTIKSLSVKDLENILEISTKIPCVLDAGVLDDLYNLRKKINSKSNNIILLPHPGEWNKMIRKDLYPDSMDDMQLVFDIANEMNAYIFYKSSTPILIIPKSKYQKNKAIICNGGDISLAKAGSGDVLAGIIAAHCAIGYDNDIAIIRSMLLMYKAAKLAVKKIGKHSITASDIISNIGLV